MEVGSAPWLARVDDLDSRIGESLSLEATVLGQRAAELRSEATKLARQRAFLRQERRRARIDSEALHQDKAELEQLKRDDWLPRQHLPPPSARRVRINVGGQVFEAAEATLRRDPHTLLAALCDDECPLKTDDDGVVYVDRDWWVFRNVLKFLRDGVLPEDRHLLTQLYREAGFWRCESLKRAIEQTQLSLYRRDFELDKATGHMVEKPVPDKPHGWWAEPPDWWHLKEAEKAKPPAVSAAKAAAGGAPSAATKDWWSGSEYKGRRYSVISAAPAKVVTGAADPDALPAMRTTWSYQH